MGENTVVVTLLWLRGPQTPMKKKCRLVGFGSHATAVARYAVSRRVA
jgi:hypothetical protein